MLAFWLRLARRRQRCAHRWFTVADRVEPFDLCEKCGAVR